MHIHIHTYQDAYLNARAKAIFPFIQVHIQIFLFCVVRAKFYIDEYLVDIGAQSSSVTHVYAVLSSSLYARGREFYEWQT